MANYSNITGGLKIPTQIPLDIKSFIKNETFLSNLGVADNLAFTYHDGLKVYCNDNQTSWIWKEVLTGFENTGLLLTDFIYPNNIVTNDIIYSNKRYNFFLLPSVPTKLSELNNDTNYITLNDIPTPITPVTYLAGTGLSLISNTFNNTAPDQVVLLTGTGATTVTGTYPNFNISSVNTTYDGSETKLSSGTNITLTGLGTIASPYVINNTLSAPTGSETKLTSGSNIVISGTGTVTSPYVINASILTYSAGLGLTLNGTIFNIDNLQKVITYPADFTGTNYTLTNADNNYEIIINNNATAVTITVPNGLISKIGIGFTQKGTGDVTYISSATTINNPIGLKIKGQFYQTYLSQELNSNIYFLGGNTKI